MPHRTMETLPGFPIHHPATEMGRQGLVTVAGVTYTQQQRRVRRERKLCWKISLITRSFFKDRSLSFWGQAEVRICNPRWVQVRGYLEAQDMSLIIQAITRLEKSLTKDVQ